MHCLDFFDVEGCKRERYERGDAVARAQVNLADKLVADRAHFADKHAAAPGVWVMVFAALFNKLQNDLADSGFVAVSAAFYLGETCGVDV